MSNWKLNFKKMIKILFQVVFAIGLMPLIGGYFTYQYLTLKPTITQEAQTAVNTDIMKSDEYTEISQKLSNILDDVQALKAKIDAKSVDKLKPSKIGINNYELKQWEVSLSGNGKLNFGEGDKIYIINNVSDYKQSGVFTVKFIGNNPKDECDLYINVNSATYLGVESPVSKGEFYMCIEKYK